MESVIVVFGIPGGGKGTRISEFEKVWGKVFDKLSMGDLLRAEREAQTELGKLAEPYMKAGGLVPDEIISSVAIKGLKAAKRPIITDGFPRTVVQAHDMLNAGITPDLVIELWVPDEVVRQRARDRLTCSKCGESYTKNSFKHPKNEGVCDKCGGELITREDDKEETVEKRIRGYHKDTYPTLDVFRENGIEVHTIDNTKSEEATAKFEELLLTVLSK